MIADQATLIILETYRRLFKQAKEAAKAGDARTEEHRQMIMADMRDNVLTHEQWAVLRREGLL